ncbi:MAG TPA: hypothetical protein VNZ22_04360, partial [Bacillota bacterium]|nr:hypothetical protein [Bacillota bacterium]
SSEPSQELLRLRGEVGLLRRQNQALAKLLSERQQATSATDFVPSSSWTDSGNATPEAAVNTFAWAMKTGNKDKLAEVLVGADPAATNAVALIDEVAKGLQPLMSAIDASRLLVTDTNTPDQVTLWFQSRFKDGQTLVSPLTLQRAGSTWKVRLVPGEGATAN